MEFIVEEISKEFNYIEPNIVMVDQHELSLICDSDYCFDCGSFATCGDFGI